MADRRPAFAVREWAGQGAESPGAVVGAGVPLC